MSGLLALKLSECQLYTLVGPRIKGAFESGFQWGREAKAFDFNRLSAAINIPLIQSGMRTGRKAGFN